MSVLIPKNSEDLRFMLLKAAECGALDLDEGMTWIDRDSIDRISDLATRFNIACCQLAESRGPKCIAVQAHKENQIALEDSITYFRQSLAYVMKRDSLPAGFRVFYHVPARRAAQRGDGSAYHAELWTVRVVPGGAAEAVDARASGL